MKVRYTPSSSTTSNMRQNHQLYWSCHNIGLNMPPTTIKNLMGHGDPPRLNTESYTVTKRGTRITYIGMLAPTLDSYAPLQVPAHITFSWLQSKKTWTVKTRNMCDLTPDPFWTTKTTEANNHWGTVISGKEIRIRPPTIRNVTPSLNQHHAIITYHLP